MSKNTVLLIAFAIFLSVSNCKPVDDTKNITVTPIGISSMTLDTDFGYGSLLTADNGGFWILSTWKNELLEYSVESGFLRRIDIAAVTFVNNAIKPYILKKMPRGYDLYELKPKLNPALIDHISPSSAYISGYSTNTAINTTALYTASENWGTPQFTLYRYNRSTGVCIIRTIETNSKIFSINGVAASETNLYVLVWLETGRFIYRFNAGSLQLKDTFELNQDLILNPVNLMYRSSLLYINDSETLATITLSSDGALQTVRTVNTNARAAGIVIYRAVPYGSDYICMGTRNSISSTLLYDSAAQHFRVIEEPDVSGAITYKTRGIAAKGSRVYIVCGEEIKLFEKDEYAATISLDAAYPFDGVNKLAVTPNDLIIAARSDYELGLIDNSLHLTTSTTGMYIVCAVEAEESGTVLCRWTFGNNEGVARYDPADSSITELFSFAQPELVNVRDICVTPGNSVVINFNTQLKKYDLNGNLVKSGPDWSAQLSPQTMDGIVYSACHNLIFAIGGSDLFAVDPVSLEIINQYSLTADMGNVNPIDISVNADGVLYVSDGADAFYKVILN